MLTKLYTKLASRMVYLKSKKGQTLVEYGLILALVSIVVIVVLGLLGNQLKNIFNTITNTLGANGGS
ncbi:MAG: Flp family type IVb pilin [Methylacidiphilales bacterium]|nr:Flp family type IVb pilin [Candidatus Methylacidiphilales bacterium]